MRIIIGWGNKEMHDDAIWCDDCARDMRDLETQSVAEGWTADNDLSCEACGDMIAEAGDCFVIRLRGSRE